MTLRTSLEAALATLADLERIESVIDRAAASIVEALRGGYRILVCGNGGSASEAQHFVTELVGRYRSNRRPLPALYLGGDAGQITCIANDFAWDDVFARPLRALGQKGDILLCLSTSGRSSNIVAVLNAANELGLESIALLGRDGGLAAPLASHPLIVGSHDTARIQEAHLFLIHLFCDYIERAFPRQDR